MTDDLRNDLLARVEQLEAELRTRDNAEATHRITLRGVQAEIMRLQTKCDRLEADAMRYRWLMVTLASLCATGDPIKPQMDAAIDAAIAIQNNQQKGATQ